jgi:hypothetical protein
LINCLAYIDLNPLRAGLVDRPEEYRCNSLGYHIQIGSKDNFLSLDLGLREFGMLDAVEILKRYRRYVYEVGALDRPGKLTQIYDLLYYSTICRRSLSLPGLVW